MKHLALRSFLKKFNTYSSKEQTAIAETVDQIVKSFADHHVSHGLGIKKLYDKIYEARINLHLRIAFFIDKDTIKFFFIGNHDDIKRMLKTLSDRQLDSWSPTG